MSGLGTIVANSHVLFSGNYACQIDILSPSTILGSAQISQVVIYDSGIAGSGSLTAQTIELGSSTSAYLSELFSYCYRLLCQLRKFICFKLLHKELQVAFFITCQRILLWEIQG